MKLFLVDNPQLAKFIKKIFMEKEFIGMGAGTISNWMKKLQIWLNENRSTKKLLSNFDKNIFFDYDLKKKNWFNIGGKSKFSLKQTI